MSRHFDARGAKFVGQPVPRREDPKFLRGRGQFVDDLSRPGMLELAFARSTHPHAEIRDIDKSEAVSLPGVEGVFTAEDLEGVVEPLLARSKAPAYQPAPWYVLARDRVRYVGEAVAAVAARNRYQAEDAAALVGWQTDELPSLVDVREAAADGAPEIHPEVSGNLFNHAHLSDGDVDGAFAAAACTVELSFHSQRVSPMCLEPRAVLAEWGADGGLMVWCSHQAPHVYRSGLARFLGLEESRIRVVSPDVGGGFGSKVVLYPEDLVAIAVAKLLGRPVKWCADRYEDLLGGVHGRDQFQHLEIATDAEGHILGLRADIKSNNGAYPPWPVTSALDCGMTAAYLPGPYKVGAYERTLSAVATNKAPMGPYRGIGRVTACLCMERLMDEVARKLDIDPLELRKRNVIRDFPHQNISGFNYAVGSHAEAIEKMEGILDIPALREEQRKLRDEGVYRGIGFAASIEHSAIGPGFASSRGLEVILANDAALVRLEPDGTITVLVATHSQGQGHETTFAQLVADQFGVAMESVVVRFGDTAVSPYGMGTWGSRSLVYASGAIGRASAEVIEKLMAIASHRLEIGIDDLYLEAGEVRVEGNSELRISLAEVGRIANQETHFLPDGMEPGLEAQRNYQAPDPGTFANALHAVIVEVDIQTGAIEILRYVAIEDCGPVLNPLVAHGQMQGGVAQGLGQALLEDFSYSDDGQPQNVSLADYLVPTAGHVPKVEIHHLVTKSPGTSGGYKGMAEGGTINAPGAIANAIGDALAPFGVVVDRLPLTPQWILEQVAQRRIRRAGQG